MKRLVLSCLALILTVASWTPMASAAASYHEGWDVPDDLAGWVQNTIHDSVYVINAGGNPGGYLKCVRLPGGVFPIGAQTLLPDATGDYAAAGVFEVSFDARFDVGTFTSAVFRVRYLDSSHNGWYIPFTNDFTPGVWKSYAIPFDPTWSDAQALAAGWIQEATSATFAETFAHAYNAEVRISGTGEPLEASIDNYRIRTCRQSKPILNANFNADTPGLAPDVTLPGPPAGDYLVLNEPSGTVRVATSVGTLTDQPILMAQVPGIGAVDVWAYAAPYEGCNLIRVSWNSLARSNDIFFLACVLRDGAGLILGSVEYRANGVLTYNSVGGVGPALPVPYTPDVDQKFEMLVDPVAKTTSLSVDGVALAGFQNVPYAQPAAGALARVGFEGGGTFAQQFAIDNIAMAACDCPCAVDNTPPTLTVTLTPDELWPPNHKMADIHATVTAEDDCDASPDITLISITSDEPDNGLGDGDFPDDIQGASYGTADYDFQLRSERQGGSDGRVYTVCYSATDAAGNTTTVCDTVFVPHDQSGHASLVADADGAYLVIYGRSYAPVYRIPNGSVALGNNDFQRVWLNGTRTLEDRNADGELDVVIDISPDEGDKAGARKDRPGLYARWSNRGTTYLATLDPSLVAGVGGVPTRLAVSVRPNPAVGMALIRCALPREMEAELSVFDVAGRELARLADGVLPAGEHTLSWRPSRGAGAGLYLYRLRTPEGTIQGRFIVVQ